jgi:2-amino-4-hydroxy-6-hydroxymethyldihydropteridine diphosphokinase
MQYYNKAYLLIGGNLGDRVSSLNQARALLTLRAGSITAVSAIYETAPWGIAEQASFLNQALQLETSLTAEELMQHILHAEEEIGRVRAEKYGPRIIDIDILLFNNEAFSHPTVTVPHPQLANRRFALQPLTEIAATYVHPILKKTISELLDDCPDTLPVQVYNVA